MATKCPIGDECADGEFCYRDFTCDPQLILATTATPSTETSAVMSTVSDNDSMGNDLLVSDASSNPLAEGQQIPSEFCSLCASDGQLIRSEPVTYAGNEISCGEFGWIFLSKNIADGSDKCLDIQTQYAGTCCSSKSSGDECDLCNAGIDRPWHDVQAKEVVQFEGNSFSCVELSNEIRARFDPTSERCIDLRGQYFNDCW